MGSKPNSHTKKMVSAIMDVWGYSTSNERKHNFFNQTNTHTHTHKLQGFPWWYLVNIHYSHWLNWHFLLTPTSILFLHIFKIWCFISFSSFSPWNPWAIGHGGPWTCSARPGAEPAEPAEPSIPSPGRPPMALPALPQRWLPGSIHQEMGSKGDWDVGNMIDMIQTPYG